MPTFRRFTLLKAAPSRANANAGEHRIAAVTFDLLDLSDADEEFATTTGVRFCHDEALIRSTGGLISTHAFPAAHD